MSISKAAYKKLERIAGKNNCSRKTEDLVCYAYDATAQVYVPDAVVYHVGSATSGGKHSDFSIYHGHRNLVWTYIKDMPAVLFIGLLPLHLLMNLVSVVWFTLHGKGAVILRAKIDAINGIPKMWRKRKLIQSNRTASLKDIWRVMDKRLIPWNHRY